jgi:hypothetical protein
VTCLTVNKMYDGRVFGSHAWFSRHRMIFRLGPADDILTGECLGLTSWDATLQVRGRLQALLLANIRREREGQLIDRSLMRSTLSMLVDLGIEGTAVYEVSAGSKPPILKAQRV